jgi:flagellar biosynthesis protein FlhG
VAAAALRSFRPGLIINRTSGRSQVNVLYLRKILQDYVGGDLMMLGEIPEDPAVGQAVRKFLPVIESAPESSSGKGLLAVSAVVEQLVAAYAARSNEQKKRVKEEETDSLPSKTECALHLLPFNQLKAEIPSSVHELRSLGRADVLQHPEENKEIGNVF